MTQKLIRSHCDLTLASVFFSWKDEVKWSPVRGIIFSNNTHGQFGVMELDARKEVNHSLHLLPCLEGIPNRLVHHCLKSHKFELPNEYLLGLTGLSHLSSTKMLTSDQIYPHSPDKNSVVFVLKEWEATTLRWHVWYRQLPGAHLSFGWSDRVFVFKLHR